MKTRIYTFFMLITLMYPQAIETEGELCSRMNQTMRDEAEILLTWEQLKYDVIYYQIHLNINPEMRSIAGELTMQAVITDESIQNIELNFFSGEVWHDIPTVLFEADTSEYTFMNNRVSIPFIDDPFVGDTVEVTIFWETPTYPITTTWEFNFNSYNDEALVFSLSEALWAHYWWPCKDHPSDKPDSMDIYITVPSDYYAVSNGSVRSNLDNGDGTHTIYWHESYPIATYLFSINVYPYFVWSDEYVSALNDTMPIMFYTFEDTVGGGELVDNYLRTKDMISTFADLFSEYPFLEEKYGHAQVIGNRAMEHQTISMLPAHNEKLIVHELAHQWWGDMISPESFHHLWLNEGFASYSEALWDERQYGFDSYLSNFTNSVFYSESSIFIVNPNFDAPLYDQWLRYEKPAFVLHMLRHVVGDETFFEILQTYAEEPAYKYSTATTEDFRGICEDVSGMDLEQFFDQWIYGLNHPIYNYDWRTLSVDGGYTVELMINQSQEYLDPFTMPIDIEITDGGGATIHVVQDYLETQFFDLTVLEDPLQLVIDPYNWILEEHNRVQYFTPYGTNVQVNSLYQRPGEDILVFTAEIFNPDSNQTSLSAIIEGNEQTLAPNAQLFDDGSGFDELASDGIFTGSWTVPPGEQVYNIDIQTTLIDSGYSIITDNLSVFTTAGPLVFGGLGAGTDSSMEPGGSISFRIAITNQGETFDASDVTAQISSLDTLFNVHNMGQINYGEIGAGETVDNWSGLFRIDPTGGFVGQYSVPIAIDIFELGQLFWQDTFMFSIVIVGIDDEINRPSKYSLDQNYPNPFNPSTTIKYGLPQASDVSLIIYNLQGEEVYRVVNESQQAGWYEQNWNGVDDKGQTVATGLYLARLESGRFSRTIKMVYMK